MLPGYAEMSSMKSITAGKKKEQESGQKEKTKDVRY
jgi:hypothetical protein